MTASSGAVEATFEPGDVVKLWYQSTTVGSSSGTCSYALYYGHGRVVHVWSSMRTHFRMRIDSLRSLAASGVVAANVTQKFDEYCDQVLGVQPLPVDQILPRSINALHSRLDNQCLTLPLILWARYGDIVITMAKSLFRVLPTMARLVGIVGPVSTASDSVIQTLTMHYPEDEGSSSEEEDDDERVDRHEIEQDLGPDFAAEVEEAINQLTDIQSLYASGIGNLLAEWIRCTFVATEAIGGERGRIFGMVASLPGEPPAFLVFSQLEQFFCVFFRSDDQVLDRLVHERMECGICLSDLSNVKIKVLECFHFLCQDCLGALARRICPYCRSSIRFVSQVSKDLKRLALTRIRESEIRALAANDFDAPEPSAPALGLPVTSATIAKQYPVDPQGYDGDVDDTDDFCSLEDADENVANLAMQLQDVPVFDENVEMLVMQREDVPVLEENAEMLAMQREDISV